MVRILYFDNYLFLLFVRKLLPQSDFEVVLEIRRQCHHLITSREGYESEADSDICKFDLSQTAPRSF